LFFAALIKVRV